MVIEVDVTLNPSTQFVHGGQDVPIEVLVLEDGPERFCAGVVVTRTRLTHRSSDAQLCTERDDVVIGELTAAIGVKPNSA